VVLPAYNESTAIAGSLHRLIAWLEGPPDGPALWRTWEILVVDDGSSDGTAAAAHAVAAREPRVQVLRRESHEGKGAAVAAGLAADRASWLLVTDVDLSYALEDLRAAVALLAAAPGPALVTGDRRHPSSRMSLELSALSHVMRRQILSAAFNLWVRLFYGVRWRDTQCGLKALRREAALAIAPRLRTRRFLADVEFFLIAQGLGMQVGSIPVHLTYLSSNSTVHALSQSPAVLADCLRIKWAQLRGNYRRV
jgi:dolichyl-phosphate beta-glucosyltransferase